MTFWNRTTKDFDDLLKAKETEATIIAEGENMIEILIVEDEFIVADDLASILESSGYIVSGVTDSGEEGIVKATELRPHIVLMDIFLKGRLTGIEAAEKIEESLKIPVVFLTGQSTLKQLKDLKEKDPCGYIMKPFITSELIACLENVAKHHKISAG